MIKKILCTALVSFALFSEANASHSNYSPMAPHQISVKASHAEIAACCLWHTSFWGYLPYQREESFRKIITDDPRLIRTAKFYKNKFSEIIPSKREMMQIPSFRNKIRSDMKSVRNSCIILSV